MQEIAEPPTQSVRSARLAARLGQAASVDQTELRLRDIAVGLFTHQFVQPCVPQEAVHYSKNLQRGGVLPLRSDIAVVRLCNGNNKGATS